MVDIHVAPACYILTAVRSERKLPSCNNVYCVHYV